MVDTDPRPVLRQELTRVFKNQRVVRAFEKIFDLIPPEFINQQIQIDAITLVSELAVSQTAESLAAIERLTNVLDRLAVAPCISDIILPDDVSPRVEVGTLASQQADAVSITAGAVTSTLTDDTNILLASSTTLANGAGVAAGTLLNAPAAGNPTKWVTINDNGVNRQVPTW